MCRRQEDGEKYREAREHSPSVRRGAVAIDAATFSVTADTNTNAKRILAPSR
jgi:hypothetical protein